MKKLQKFLWLLCFVINIKNLTASNEKIAAVKIQKAFRSHTNKKQADSEKHSTLTKEQVKFLFATTYEEVNDILHQEKRLDQLQARNITYQANTFAQKKSLDSETEKLLEQADDILRFHNNPQRSLFATSSATSIKQDLNLEDPKATHKKETDTSEDNFNSNDNFSHKQSTRYYQSSFSSDDYLEKTTLDNPEETYEKQHAYQQAILAALYQGFITAPKFAHDNTIFVIESTYSWIEYLCILLGYKPSWVIKKDQDSLKNKIDLEQNNDPVVEIETTQQTHGVLIEDEQNLKKDKFIKFTEEFVDVVDVNDTKNDNQSSYVGDQDKQPNSEE